MMDNLTTTVSLLSTTMDPALANATAVGPRSVVFDAFLKTACLLILSVGTIGNIIVVITFGMRGSRLKTCEIFMINLALADLVGTACLPLITFFELQKISLAPIKDVGCQWLYTFNLTSLTVSAFTLVCIAADRYIVVTRPFRTRPHKGKVVLVSLATWLLSFALGAVYLFDGVRVELSFCRGNMSTRSIRVHSIMVFLFQVSFPMVVMAVLYCLTLNALRVSRSQALIQNNRMMAVRLKQNRRTTRLFLTVVATFYTLILPHNIFMMIYTFNFNAIPYTTAFYLYYTTMMVHMVNSCVNPLIYARMHHPFRGAALNCLCCRTDSLSHTAWRSFIQSRNRLSSGWTKTTTVNSRETATSELGQTLCYKQGCPSPVTESFNLNGGVKTRRKDTNANVATDARPCSQGSSSRPNSWVVRPMEPPCQHGSSNGCIHERPRPPSYHRSGYCLVSPPPLMPGVQANDIANSEVITDILTSL